MAVLPVTSFTRPTSAPPLDNGATTGSFTRTPLSVPIPIMTDGVSLSGDWMMTDPDTVLNFGFCCT